MPENAPQIHPISRAEKRTISVDCSGNLEGNAVVTGAPSVLEKSTNHLTIASVQISSTQQDINGKLVPAGKAILFTVDARGGSVRPDHTYRIILTFDTSDGERVAGAVRLKTD